MWWSAGLYHVRLVAEVYVSLGVVILWNSSPLTVSIRMSCLRYAMRAVGRWRREPRRGWVGLRRRMHSVGAVTCQLIGAQNR